MGGSFDGIQDDAVVVPSRKLSAAAGLPAILRHRAWPAPKFTDDA
jgi:hypothetical protein